MKLTQFKEGSNPGVKTEDESRITMTIPMVMNSTSLGIDFSPNDSTGSQVNISFESDINISKSIDINGSFSLTGQENDVFGNYLSLLKQFYAQLDDTEKQYFEAHFDTKSYLSVSMDSNYLNSSFPLWRSYDVFEGPIEYSSATEQNSDFENLIYFSSDAMEIDPTDNSGSICILLRNKTASTVTANLIVRGPEHFDYNSEVPINSTDLNISSPILNWGSDDPQKCVTLSKSDTYNDSDYDRIEAYYYLEIVPEGDGTVYRGDRLLVQVPDNIR